MITVNGHRLEPTIFPDKTSQVWQLPKIVTEAETLDVTWMFESERELFDLLSLRKIQPGVNLYLTVPYLPYGRQDKDPRNDTAFNLHVFADLIEALDVKVLRTVDVHNEVATKKLIPQLENRSVDHIHKFLVESLRPDCLVFPDMGARRRYSLHHPNQLVFEKKRNPATGEIVGLDAKGTSLMGEYGHAGMDRLLIVDDICDGGATFIGIANYLKVYATRPIDIYLFTTHGLFSKGKDVLKQAGIIPLTTNSLLQNADSPFEVCK